jgi:hypothetical protein
MVDAVVLEQVLTHIHNFFVYDEQYVRCEVTDGSLPASISIPDGAWYRIQGSLLNDGLHRHPAEDLIDETFDGTITVCAIPRALLDVVEEIEEWQAAYKSARQKALGSPYQSESFDGYSYNLRSDLAPSSASGGLTGWQAEFAGRLSAWRKMY